MKGVAMCRAMEEMRDQAAAAAKLEERRKFAVSLWNDGIKDIARISKLTNISENEVNEGG